MCKIFLDYNVYKLSATFHFFSLIFVMSGLTMSMLCSISDPICSVYNSNIRRIIRSNCTENLPLLYYILNRSVVPDNAFRWLVESKHSSVPIISYLIEKRLWLDKTIQSIVSTLNKSDVEYLTCSEMDKLLDENCIVLTVYEKHYLFSLLAENRSMDPLEKLWEQPYDCGELYPVNRISTNYTSTRTLLDEAICEAARLADHKMLTNILTAAADHELQYQFNPKEHKDVLTWLKDNIAIGCSSDKTLGWSTGPDSAKWPSTELKDYVKTLNCLYDLML